MAVCIVSCATVDRAVRVPVLRGMSVEIRPVRVLLGLSTKSKPLALSASKPVTVFSGDVERLDTITLKKAQVSLVHGGNITIGGHDSEEPVLQLVPQKGDYVAVGDREYAGRIVLSKYGDAVQVVNYVEMENYIAGVVSCELPRRFSHAAHEAQAVAARTYALWQMSLQRLLPYDVHATEASQVYRGVGETYSFGTSAARTTAGVVMVYDWKFLPAFYSSTCGGHTAPVSQLEPRLKMKPLEPVACNYCSHSRLYTWGATMPLDEAEEILAKAGHTVGRLKDIKVVSTVTGGWVDDVQIISTEGTRHVTGKVFRDLIGTRKLMSAKFKITKAGDRFVISGHGFGHGVGMCQFGADGYGRKGHNYVEILNFYYNGADVIKIY